MKYLFLNHKMNLTKPEIEEYIKNFPLPNYPTLEVVIIPSNLYLPYFDKDNFILGSQNVSSLKEGSLTGDISAKQCKSLDIKYCLVGHSERRKYYKETNDEIKNKINNLKEENIIPILCVGEEDVINKTTVLNEELSIFKDINLDNIIIAYEPIYSIGTGNVLENKDIEKSVELIKKIIQEYTSRNVKVVYGGSVDDNNIEILSKISNIDGFLVGKASLNIEKVIKMMEVLNDSNNK